MSEKLEILIDISTDKAVKAAKDLAKATSSLNDELDDTTSHAERVADVMDAATAEMVADMKAANKAAAALGTALGPELAAKVGSAKLDEFMGQLRRAGVSFDDITANADRFADSLRKMDDATGSFDNVQQAAARTGEELGKSKGVLANFVGNAAQELPGLSGAFGPLNTAIGQFAEYAAEGDVTLTQFLKAAGPVAAIGAGFAIFSSIMEELGRHEKEVKEQAEKLVKVQTELADAQYSTAASDLANQYGDLIGKAKQYGLTTQDVVNVLQGNNAQLDVLKQRLAAIPEVDVGNKNYAAFTREREALYELTDGLQVAQEAYSKSGTQVSTNTTLTNELAQALQNNAKGADDAASAEARRTEAAAKAKTMAEAQLEVEKALTEAYLARNASVFDTEKTSLELDNTYAGLIKSEADLQLVLKDSKKSAEDKAIALRDLRIKQLDAAEAVLTAAQDYASSQGATENSSAAIKIQIDYLEEQRKKYPQLSDEIATYISNLEKIPKTVNTEVKVIGGMRKYAGGTGYHPGGTALVGEQGPELVDLPRGSRVFTASQTRSMARTGTLNAATGSTTNTGSIVINVLSADPEAVVEAIKRHEARNGSG